jgi:ribonuclease P protein component
MQRLTRRQDFVAAAKAGYSATPGLVLQVRERGDNGPSRVGVTATKKLGNAVVRNRVKRRLRELARLRLAHVARQGCDYVLIGRPSTVGRPFNELEKDLNSALKRLQRRPSEAGEMRRS